MRYAGGYNSNRPWNDVTNPLVLRRNESWRIRPTIDFTGGSLEGLVTKNSSVSDYLVGSGYVAEATFLQRRGFTDGTTKMTPWVDMYPSVEDDMEISPEIMGDDIAEI